MSAREPSPILLPPNQPPDRFYRGGKQIRAFRGEGAIGDRVPEDWIGSTTCVRGHHPIGMTFLEEGTTLAAAVAADPEWWLGKEHVHSFGSDTKLLVKLLDAGQRLPIHAHPHHDFAAAHLSATHGKAEAWYILAPGVIHLGLARDISMGELKEIVHLQQTSRLLEAMHSIPVACGDRVYVPPGVLHSIGEGVLLAEVQEPEDLSILLEWSGFDIDGERESHLGLGFPRVLKALELSARSPEEIKTLTRSFSSAELTLPTDADEYFRLERCHVETESLLEPGFAILIVLEGHLNLAGAHGEMAASRGSTILVPAAFGEFSVRGKGTLLVARPPRP